MNVFIWIGIVICISQSAMFSGLNLAFFSVSKLFLEIETNKKNKQAIKIAKLRKDSNFLLSTILWGNVGINVLLTLLSNSVLAGLSAFIFSTVLITFLGEIIPQAYFSRHALKAASILAPVIYFYQILLYPVAKPTSLILNKWLGSESIHFFQERDLHELIQIHMDSPETDIHEIEGTGVRNFLDIDDLLVEDEGETINPESIIEIQFKNDTPIFPPITQDYNDAFLKKVHNGRKKWTVLVDEKQIPRLALDSNAFLRSALFGEKDIFNPQKFCHKPIIIPDTESKLGNALQQLKVFPEKPGDDVIDEDIILVWGVHKKQIITGSDILGRLLRGIVQQYPQKNRKE
jgi:metal transporter CNNM